MEFQDVLHVQLCQPIHGVGGFDWDEVCNFG
jgi:hypothetical protein